MGWLLGYDMTLLPGGLFLGIAVKTSYKNLSWLGKGAFGRGIFEASNFVINFNNLFNISIPDF
jgi:hypothetical protein